jgi:glycosyltransferase involved in cell wall biosynthesis
LTIQRVAVVVPAADEQDRIAACLRAVERARRRLLRSGLGVSSVDVFVVLDACVDGTADVVARYTSAFGHQVVHSSARCVGAARQRGTLRAIGTLAPAERLWLANTDADSMVPVDWLTSMVGSANAGADLVLGTVLPDVDLPRALRAAWLAEHRLEPGHPHIHGANLGISAATYLALGGWRPLSADEDVDLVRRAELVDVEIVRTSSIPVITSARMLGRTPTGFSSYLRRLRDHGPLVVEGEQAS